MLKFRSFALRRLNLHSWLLRASSSLNIFRLSPHPSTTMAEQKQEEPRGIMASKFPVFVPKDDALFFDSLNFHNFIRENVKIIASDDSVPSVASPQPSETTTLTLGREAPSAGTDAAMDMSTSHPYMAGLATHTVPSRPEQDFKDRIGSDDNKMLTENDDIAHVSTQSPLINFFYELERTIRGPRLKEILDVSWKQDPLATLKVIWNARSIHLGKSDRESAYKAFGWLAENHPQTLILNLRWLTRPIIKKKADKKEGIDSDLVVVDAPPQTLDESTMHDVKYGASHGYWKDLLNVLALAANDELSVNGSPREVLNVTDDSNKRKRDWDPNNAKSRKALRRVKRHEQAVVKFRSDPVYRGLHLMVARLFAEQLKADKKLLDAGDKMSLRNLSLAAKWAPTAQGFHDEHTYIVSTIAELLYPQKDYFSDAQDRNEYLKLARENYRRLTVSPLRKALEVVERDITAGTFSNIKYDRVPSIAMNNYTTLFLKKDTDRFTSYIDKVAEGKKRISGATLLPSKLIMQARDGSNQRGGKSGKKAVEALAAQRALNGQWNALVQRIRDSGTLQSSIAVADVSGSMLTPLPDGTKVIDSSIGLSLLMAEITAPPFGGAFITFSQDPAFVKVGGESDKRSLEEKVRVIEQAPWGMNTDFIAVFERLLLPVAVENKVKPEDMVKQVFVFSDMHFDSCGGGKGSDWETSYDRVTKKYEEAGYEMPTLVFWNLAGGRPWKSPEVSVAPKPVTAADDGTALVSGYSQGQMKMFLENGTFDEPEEEVEMVEDDDGDVVVKKKVKTDPLTIVKRAIDHEAYSMLEVFD